MPGTPSEAQSRHTLMTETPIPRLVTRMAMPTMASMLVTSIYNMADTYFVGMLGQSASGAVGVVFTLMLFIQAIGFTLGMGSGANIAQLLGAKDEETASRIASTGFFTSLLLGLVLAVGGLVFLDPWSICSARRPPSRPMRAHTAAIPHRRARTWRLPSWSTTSSVRRGTPSGP